MSTEQGRPLPGLPVQLTSFVGREHELAQAATLLENTRLLTLTGPGGSGKTRLSIQLASQVSRRYPGGVYFVPLAPIRDPALVLPSIAQAIGLHDARDSSLVDHLADHLRERTALLVLDNFEQLLGASPLIARLLQQTLAPRLMITSRACLRLSGEQEFDVPPLALPSAHTVPVAATVAAAESVRLFVARARAAVPSFTVDDENAVCLAQIAARLDGLPLAIELAASRVKLLPPESMLPRLEHSLGLLVSRSRDLPDRQQTLRAAIAWSYGLLGRSAQRLLAVLSVFRGGASLEHIEAICAAAALSNRDPLLEDLEELLDHSLLRRVESRAGPRLVVLETIREFAAERLVELEEQDRVRQCHASVFQAVTVEGERQLCGTGEKQWLDLLEVEHNNIRAAIDFYSHESPDVASRMATAMRPFWSARGHFTEGRQRLRTLLEQVPEWTRARVRALNCAAWLAVDQGDYADAESRLTESIGLSRDLHDALGEGQALAHLGRCRIAAGHPSEAVIYLDTALPILRANADLRDLAVGMLYWGLGAIFTGRPDVACERLAEAAAMCRQIGFRSLGARAQYLLSVARVEMGDLSLARTALEEAFPIALELGDHWIIAQHMGAFAGLAAQTGRPREALRLAGFQLAYSRAHEFSVPTVMRATFESWLRPAMRALGDQTAALLAEGEQLTIEQAAALALNGRVEAVRSARPAGLTRREFEVAKLVATGSSNRDIAQQLCLSARTVEVHVDHILTKLDFSSRTQLAAWMHQRGLAPEDT